MKTLILYATKHGAAKDIAQRIAKRIPGATVCDLASNVPELDGFDCVVLGSSLYAGMARKEAKAFAAKHEDALKTKRLGLFLSGMSPNDPTGYLNSNYPKPLVAASCAKAMLGGIADPAKENFFERLVMKIVVKKSQYINTISDDKIQQFVSELTK